MIYGLYLSASGVQTNSYRQDIIANNLANSETTGFKRDLAFFKERRTALAERHLAGDYSDPTLEKIGGGILALPTTVDTHQGDLVHTGNPLDVAIEGEGFFAVKNGTARHLTRNGQFMVNRDGELILSGDQQQRVLDTQGNVIHLQPGSQVAVAQDGLLTQNGKAVAQLALFDVADKARFTKQGGTLIDYPAQSQLKPATGLMHGEFTEQSNVDPTSELADLMDTQRQLEANANMIKYQDTTMQELVETVGKVS